ncbi:hypothetical protein ACHAAC_12295 [Aeromicrobium sp. CF4.19]|uniref:hypothetical protein n=1 Tax=Aeromicrobium sp. CF4.19 TaxID=3373082 RepID=UPI003EE55A9B
MATSPRRRRYHPSSPFQAPPEVVHPVYAVGDRVSHDTWGLGRIVSLESDIAVSVDFAGTMRRITLPSKQLEAL